MRSIRDNVSRRRSDPAVAELQQVLVLALVLAALVPGKLHGEVILGNLPGNDGTWTSIRGQLDPGTADSKAVGFTMPSEGTFTLEEVVLRLEILDPSSDPVVQIYDDDRGLPSTPLVTLEDPELAVGLTDFIFTLLTPLTLEPNTSYWLVVWNESLGADIFRWQASVPNVVPIGIAGFVDFLFDFGPPPPMTPSSVFNSFALRSSPTVIFTDGFESGDTSAW